jgi:hypothetical protein
MYVNPERRIRCPPVWPTLLGIHSHTDSGLFRHMGGEEYTYDTQKT